MDTYFPSVSLVLPAYNEETLIGETLEALCAYLAPRFADYEILVVDDGSADQTARLAQAYGQKNGRVRLMQNERNTGKGYSIRHGVLESRGKLVIFMDADMPYSFEVIDLLAGALQDGYPVAVGSRELPESELNARVPFIRLVAGKIFSFLIQALLFRGLPDTQCGVKGFQREAARQIFGRQTIWNFGFDVEILFIARKLGYRVKPVPVRLVSARGDSKVHIVRDSLKSFSDLFLIRWNDLHGRYNTLPGEKN